MPSQCSDQRPAQRVKSAFNGVLYGVYVGCQVPYGLWCYRIDRRRVLIGGALTDGGSMLPFLDKTFGVQSG
jgi:hypothetical protein